MVRSKTFRRRNIFKILHREFFINFFPSLFHTNIFQLSNTRKTIIPEIETSSLFLFFLFFTFIEPSTIKFPCKQRNEASIRSVTVDALNARRIVTRETISCFRSMCEKSVGFRPVSACIIQAGKSVSFERGRGRSLAVSPSSINHFSPPCKKQCIAGLARDEARLESARRYLRVQKRHEYARVHTHARARIKFQRPPGAAFYFYPSSVTLYSLSCKFESLGAWISLVLLLYQTE